MNNIAKQFPTLVLLLGKSKSGKSYLLKYLLQFYTIGPKPIFQYGLVLTGSPYNHEYGFLPKHAVHEYDEELLMNYINELRKRKDESEGERLPASFLVLDDCLGLIQRTPAWQNLLSTYRHLNITIFLSVQYLKTEASSTLIREQTGVLVAFKSTNINVIKCLYDYFGSEVFENLAEFRERYANITKQRYNAMIYIADDRLQDKKNNFQGLQAPQYKEISIKY
jgi:hypothetical protein